MKLALAFAMTLLAASLSQAQTPKEIMYVGTYSVRGSEGIYVLEFDRKAGTLRQIQTASQSKSPSFLAFHPNGKFLYAVNEAPVGSTGGAVSAYALDRATGHLRFLNQQSSVGRGPCHISLDATGRAAVVSNYGEGTLTVLPVQPDGQLAPASDSVRHTGNGPNPQRQNQPHVHSATYSPDNRFVYVCDLGLDKVFIYEIDPAKGKVKPASTPFATVKPGSGPRHFTISPNGKFAYLVEELTSTTATFSRDAKTGALTLIQDNVATLPADFTAKNSSADIHTDASGKFLYQSNRGHNSLAIFSIANNGKVTLVGQQDTMGKTPRNFLVDPKGEFVFVAHQDSDNITIFKRDASTGKLTYTGQQISVPAAVCLKLMTLE